jgi:hypothetical protein
MSLPLSSHGILPTSRGFNQAWLFFSTTVTTENKHKQICRKTGYVTYTSVKWKHPTQYSYKTQAGRCYWRSVVCIIMTVTRFSLCILVCFFLYFNRPADRSECNNYKYSKNKYLKEYVFFFILLLLMLIISVGKNINTSIINEYISHKTIW